MSISKKIVKRALVCLAVATTVAACETGPDQAVVARAAGYELDVGETVALMAGSRVPAEPRLVRTLADLWIEYTLLAHAMAEDSTLSQLDLRPLVNQRIEAQAIGALGDSLIRPDTVISDEELRALWASQESNVEARARHILVPFPPSHTAAEADSIRARAEELRARVVAGEDFADLARLHSADRASALQGGDLGWIGRGQMVRSLDEAVFALEPGELSEPVETPYGYHIIRLEEIRAPDFEEAREDFRRETIARRVQEAGAAYIDDVIGGANTEVVEDAAQIIRHLGENPRVRLSGRAADRVVARYEGGAITVGEVRDMLLTRSPEFQARVANATDELIEDGLLKDLIGRELLLRRAQEGGFAPSEQEMDSLATYAREQFVRAARGIGLGPVDPLPGEGRSAAIERTVTDLIEQMFEGVRDPVPLGAIGWILRQEYPSELYGEPSLSLVVERLDRARGPEDPAPGDAPGGTPGTPGARGTTPGGTPGGAPGQPGTGVGPSDPAGGGGGSGG